MHADKAEDGAEPKTNADITEYRSFCEARRTLYGETPAKNQSVSECGSANIDISGVNIILQKLECLAVEMKNVKDSLNQEMKSVKESVNQRIDKLEVELETKITSKLTLNFSNMLDRRINNETKKINKTMDDRFDNLRKDFDGDLEMLTVKVNSLSDPLQTVNLERIDRSMNVVIRKLPETVNENLEDRLNAIIKDHLQVNDVVVSSAERITTPDVNSLVPGVVIAKFQSKEDRDKILKSKSKLSKTVYKDIYIFPDQTKEERIAAGNLRSVVNAVNRGGRLSIRGNRVVNLGNSGTHNNGAKNHQFRSGTHNNGANNNQYKNDTRNNGAISENASGATNRWPNFNNNGARGNGHGYGGRHNGQGRGQRGQGYRGQGQRGHNQGRGGQR